MAGQQATSSGPSAAPSPAGNPFSSQPSGGGQPAANFGGQDAGGDFGGSDAGGGDGGAELSPQLQELIGGLQDEVSDLRGRYDQASRSASAAERQIEAIRAALGGGDADGGGNEPDVDKEFLDEFLEASLADKTKGGSGLPLTTKLAIRVTQQAQQLQDALKVINELKQRAEILSDPNLEIDRRAYLSMDSMVQNSVAKLYDGDIDKNVVHAINNKITADIQKLQKQAPEMWDRIRRNPEFQKRMVMAHIESVIPSRARQILRDDHIQRTPMSESELLDALREAKQKIPLNHPKRNQVIESIRQEILQSRFGRSMGAARRR